MKIIYTEKEYKKSLKSELSWRDKWISFLEGALVGAIAGMGILAIVLIKLKLTGTIK